MIPRQFFRNSGFLTFVLLTLYKKYIFFLAPPEMIIVLNEPKYSNGAKLLRRTLHLGNYIYL